MKALKKIVSEIIVKKEPEDEYGFKRRKLNRITHGIYDKELLRIAEKSDLYRMADKGAETKEPERYASYIPTMIKKLSPFPENKIIEAILYLGDQAKRSIDKIIADQVSNDADMEFKKDITKEVLQKAIDALSSPPIMGQQTFGHAESYSYYICVTSKGRMAHIRKCTGWEYRMEYKDYIDRPLFGAELGRFKISNGKIYGGMYVVFLDCMKDDDMSALLFGGITPFRVTPLENNLHTEFTEPKDNPDGTNVHWRLKFSAEKKDGACIGMKAQRRV